MYASNDPLIRVKWTIHGGAGAWANKQNDGVTVSRSSLESLMRKVFSEAEQWEAERIDLEVGRDGAERSMRAPKPVESEPIAPVNRIMEFVDLHEKTTWYVTFTFPVIANP